MKRNEKNGYDLTPQNLNDAEMQNRLDLYSERGDEKQFFSIQKIKKRYLSNTRVKTDNRAISDAYLAQGYRAGFTHASPDTIKYAREIEDQNERNQILQEGRGEYRRGENLSKWFNDRDVENLHGEPEKDVNDRTAARRQMGRLMAAYNRTRTIESDPDKMELKPTYKAVQGKTPDHGIDRYRKNELIKSPGS